MRATWYVLEDGTPVDPGECVPDEFGSGFTHKSGSRIAMTESGTPQSRGVDLDEHGKPLFGGNGTGGAKKAFEHPVKPADAKDMKAAPTKRGYKTRESKAR